MITIERARQSLEVLGLARAAAVLESRLETAAARGMTYAGFLADLVEEGLAARRERCLKARIRLAYLPFHKTLDQFDFGLQPSVDEQQIRELATVAFVANATSVLFLGPPGVGKTHLAVALGLAAIEQGLAACFVTAHTLVQDLRRVHAENRLDRRLRVYVAPRLLIIDELGYLTVDSGGCNTVLPANQRAIHPREHPAQLQQKLRQLGADLWGHGDRNGHSG